MTYDLKTQESIIFNADTFHMEKMTAPLKLNQGHYIFLDVVETQMEKFP